MRPHPVAGGRNDVVVREPELGEKYTDSGIDRCRGLVRERKESTCSRGAREEGTPEGVGLHIERNGVGAGGAGGV